MSPTPTANFSFTAPINPSGVEALSLEQIWACLHRKVRHAEEFVGGAIKSTNVVSESEDEHGRVVVTRDVVFRDGDRKAREICTFFKPMKVEFLQTDGTRVVNTVSPSADGQLYLTYQFEWLMAKDTPVETQQANMKKWKDMSQLAVEMSIKAMREMVSDGRVKA